MDNKPKNDYPPTVAPLDIRKGFSVHSEGNIFDVEFRGEKFALPSLTWLDRFAESFRQFQEAMLLLPGYDLDSNKCTQFMNDALYWASVLHRNTRQDSVLAFGECLYQPDTPGPMHALCVAACREYGQIVPVPWEPQTRRRVNLSLTEWSTAEITFK